MGRPPKPKRKLPGISVVWSGGWKWRAVWKDGGKQVRGTCRATQEEAYDDYRARARIPNRGMTLPLADALEACVRDAELRGLDVLTVEKQYRSVAKALCGPRGYWEPDTDLRSLTVESVQWLVRTARQRGRSPVTIRNGYLRLLHKAFVVAGLDSPVPEAREKMRAMLSERRRPSEVMPPEHVAALIARVRNYVVLDRRGRRRRPPKRERDADLFELVAMTGLRAGEVARLKVRDVDIERRLLHVRSKVKSMPRDQPVPDDLVPALERLAGGRGPETPLIPGGMQSLNAICEHWKRRLDEPRWNLRNLRHAYATGLLMTGATIAEVRDLLGHRSLSAVTNRYLHALEDHRAAAASRLARRLRGASP